MKDKALHTVNVEYYFTINENDKVIINKNGLIKKY